MKLVKRTITTKDNHGCEFRAVVVSSYEFDDLPVKFNNLVERKYIAVGLGIQADTLDKLKEIVSKI